MLYCNSFNDQSCISNCEDGINPIDTIKSELDELVDSSKIR